EWGGARAGAAQRRHSSTPATPDATREAIWEELRRRGVPFGKFQGVSLGDVPRYYLEWVKDNIRLYPELLAEVVSAEVASRETDERERAEYESNRQWLATFAKWKAEQPRRKGWSGQS